MLPQVTIQESKVLPIELRDRVVCAGAHGYECWLMAYSKSLRERHTFKAVIAAPGTQSARRVLREELGTDWVLMDWNVG